jgi:aminoglycoside phosphotransferase (APT) family kinase protein
VIDFGCSGVGDPACELTIAWTLFFGESRETFRGRLPSDDATWARGRGWALWKAVITLVRTLETEALIFHVFDERQLWPHLNGRAAGFVRFQE